MRPATSKSLFNSSSAYSVDQPCDIAPSAKPRSCVGTIGMYGAYTAAELIRSSPLTPTTKRPCSMFGVTNTFNEPTVPAKYGPLIVPVGAARKSLTNERIGIKLDATKM